MKWKTLSALLCTFLFSVNIAEASVRVNEIAWMGTVNSSADEWIELANTGAVAVDLSGWSLRAQDGSPLITLSGTIAANNFYLIERTDDTSVPDVVADLVTPFGKGLENEGETLQLYNAEEVLIDTVVGGENWALVGGDSVTKATAQRTSSGWVTGVGTPRTENTAPAGEVLGANTEDSSVTSTSLNTSSGTSPSKPSIYPRTNIVVEAGPDQRGFTGFPVRFMGSSTGLYNESLDSATYRFNFGDGTTADTQKAEHTYAVPGEYIVTLEVFWSSYRQSDRLTVTIVNPSVVIRRATEGTSGFVELQNESSREIDISGWTLRDDTSTTFVFPSNSIILAGKFFLLPNVVSGFSDAHMLELYYPNGLLANLWNIVSGKTVSNNKLGQTTAGKVSRTEQEVQKSRIATVRRTATTKSSPPLDTVSHELATSSLASVVLWESPTSPSIGAAPFFSLLGEHMTLLFALSALLLVLFASVIIYRSREPEVQLDEEYAIIEDIIESEDSRA